MSELKQEKEVKNDDFFSENTGKILSIAGLVVIGVTILLYLIFGSWSYSWSFDEGIMGQFGDFIGGFIGSIFSLAGVILFYVALKEQRKDIGINQENFKLQTSALEQQVVEFKDQKVELSETRKVYEEQTKLLREQTNIYKWQNKELKEQSQIAKVQQFDSSFFSYLNIFNDYKQSLNKLSKNGNFFRDVLDELKDIEFEEKNINKILKQICDLYLIVFNRKRDELSPYFKTLYRIMVLIDSSNIDDYKKEEYFKLLRSQLSDVELLLLNYNYHTHYGLKVRLLIVKYNFLKHLNLLEKIEFNFNLSEKHKFHIEEFLKFNESIITEGISDFKSIENEEDIERSYSLIFLEINVEVKLQIKESFSFSIVFSNAQITGHDVLKPDFIRVLIRRHLYTILYMSKYINQNEDDLLVSTIDNGEKIEYLFKIDNIKNL